MMVMKKFCSYSMMPLIFCVLVSCVAATATPQLNYKPDITHVKSPITTIKTTIEEQPPAYAYLPSDLEVTDKAIKMTVAGGGSFLTMGIPVPGTQHKA